MTQKYEEVNIRWEKGHRYYEAHVMEDLYGWVFVRIWGKKDTRLGRSMRVRVDSCEEGLKAMKQVKKRREYRGYELKWAIYLPTLASQALLSQQKPLALHLGNRLTT